MAGMVVELAVLSSPLLVQARLVQVVAPLSAVAMVPLEVVILGWRPQIVTPQAMQPCTLDALGSPLVICRCAADQRRVVLRVACYCKSDHPSLAPMVEAPVFEVVVDWGQALAAL